MTFVSKKRFFCLFVAGHPHPTFHLPELDEPRGLLWGGSCGVCPFASGFVRRARSPAYSSCASVCLCLSLPRLLPPTLVPGPARPANSSPEIIPPGSSLEEERSAEEEEPSPGTPRQRHCFKIFRSVPFDGSDISGSRMWAYPLSYPLNGQRRRIAYF